MVTIQVRDVPDDLYDQLLRDVEASGLTFDHYVVNIIHQFCIPGAGTLSLDEVFALADTLDMKRPPPGWATAEIRRMRDAIG